jgi:hypothetical protein
MSTTNERDRSLYRRLVPRNTRDLIRTELGLLRRGATYAIRWNAMLADAWVRDRLARRHYTILDEAAARRRRTSETVFVFGSGYSLNDISPAEWAHFAAHDVFGFNAFYHQHWTKVGFHLLRGGIYDELRWRPFANEVAAILEANALFRDAVFILQEEYLAQFPNQMVGYRLMPPGAALLRYRTARGPGQPTRSIAQGLRHHAGTLTDAVNCAYCLGWKHIVLVGVDLYDSRYFYLPADQTPGIDRGAGLVVGVDRNPYHGTRPQDAHATLKNGIVELMDSWSRSLAADGVALSVHNPRSLLASVLPVYEPLGLVDAR